MKILSCFERGQVLLTLASLFSAQASFAAPLSSDRAQQIVSIYENLLHLTVSNPRITTQSLFLHKESLNNSQIQEAGQLLRQYLIQEELPETVNRILLFEQLRRGESPENRAKISLLRELDTLDQLIQNRLDHQDESRNRTHLFVELISSIGLCAGGSLIPRLSQPGPNTPESLIWSTFGGMIAAGLTGVVHAQYQSSHWTPETYWDWRDWSQQFQQAGQYLDPLLRDRVDNTLTASFLIDSDTFPKIPYYSHLLDWASSQPSLGPINFLDGVIQDQEIPQEIQVPHPDHIVIEIGQLGENTQTHPPEAASSILQDFREQNLSDWKLARLSTPDFQAAVRNLSEEMKNQPHALWSHLASRRILFLALQKQDAPALFEILKSRIGIMMPIIYPRYASFYNKALILAVKMNHLQLVQLLLNPHPGQPHLLGTRLVFENKTLRQAARIAHRRGYTTIAELLRTMNDRPRRPGAQQTRIMPNAGHETEGLSNFQDTAQILRQRYQSILTRMTYPLSTPSSIRQQIELRLVQLKNAGRINENQELAVRALFSRIDAPFDTRSPNYEPGHLFLWNTDEKKAKTRELLQLAVMALEDREAFRQLNHREMTNQDSDDNWVSWINNALVDSAHAYAIDGGRALDLERIASASSCVPGVDHRILHGLTGLHPDIHLNGGNTEQDNLRVWENAIRAAQKDRRAKFYQSVFGALVAEWVQTVAPLPQDQNERIANYKDFITSRARSLFGDAIVEDSEFRTLLETVDDNPERIIEIMIERMPQN